MLNPTKINYYLNNSENPSKKQHPINYLITIASIEI